MNILEDKYYKELKNKDENCIKSDENVIKKMEDKKDRKTIPLICMKHLVSVAFILFMIKVVYDFTKNNMMNSYLDYNQSRGLVVAIVDTLIIFGCLSSVYVLNVICPFKFACNYTERVFIETVQGINNYVLGIRVYKFKGKIKNTSKSDICMFIPVDELRNTKIDNDKQVIKFTGQLIDGQPEETKEEYLEIQNNFSLKDINKLELLVNKCNYKGDNEDVQD